MGIWALFRLKRNLFIESIKYDFMLIDLNKGLYLLQIINTIPGQVQDKSNPLFLCPPQRG